MLATKGMRFPIDVILVCIRWYAAYPLSYRHLEEMMQERGVFVDHSSINRWAIRFLPLLKKVFRKHKRPVGDSWRMDETYIKVKGAWKGFVALASQGQNFGEFFKRALAPGALMLPVHKTAWRTKVPFLFRYSFGLCGSCASAQCPPGLRWQF